MVDKEQIRFLYHLQGVRELFDEYADTFDEELVNGLRYDVPNLTRKQIPDTLGNTPAHFKRCLDLGCGTGLSGVAFRDCCDYMEGVDISPKMVKKAVALGGVYNVAKHSDLQGHLRKCSDESFDLIISCDVLMYVYDLVPLFKQVKRVLSKGGTFAFSTEALEEADVNVLERDSGRYAHSRKHVQNLAEEDGFELQSIVNVLGRMDEGKEIRSDIFVFRW
eukprot:CAMPEP_0198147620 /NCGR_PEP_ID=MMETSP1443-20131203/36901_1 /TAXON_ID=186043 /ORGANISM="Entomoneis sp., Strain CCMP2396" /LENGTH=219 /DNA_ID=CAMNT_0043812029 /DNA_START=183 /DNA_END=839 /DNA_ORIENTATION=-